jgi:hypothetical protein
VAILGVALAAAFGVTPIYPDEVSPPAPVAQVVVGPLPDLRPALPAPAVAESATPAAIATPTPSATPSATPTAAPTAQPTSQPTQTAPPPTHTPPPTPPPCTESYSSTITYTDDSGSHTLSGGPTWTYNETQPQGHQATATINQYTACNGDHLIFTISDHSNNYSCDAKMSGTVSVSIKTYTSPETVTITARFGSSC